ncbi:MAG: phospholipase, partial [Blastopirellula sp.]
IIDDYKGSLKKTKLLADRKQLQLNDGEAKIEIIEGKLNIAKTNEEFQIFKDQVAAAKMANSVTADEILEAFDRVDQLDTKIEQAGEDLKTNQADAEKIIAEVDAERQVVEADIQRLEAELEEAETYLPMDIKENYKRVALAKGEEALAKVDGETCGQCYVTLRAQIFNDLILGKPVFCSTCGAMLYIEPKS